MASADVPRVKDRLLAAGLEIFAARGFAETDVRELTRRADANLAAVNYHFGSKERLYETVLERFVFPILDEQMVRLDRLAADPVVPGILAGTLLLALQPPWRGTAAGRLFQRLWGDPGAFPLSSALGARFQHGLTRFSQAFRRLAPSMTPSEFLWRFTFFVGAANHATANIARMSEMTRGICRNDDFDGATMHLTELARVLFPPESQLFIKC
jgi:AcrR family transcriptional regulator